ncbi:MAG: hypothetical protein IPP49_20425 [Saprospiraceae bacterium]|nr:hypothetical protein [Saprospiraceae bacterium]
MVSQQDTYRTNDALLYKQQAHLEKEKKANTDKETALSDHQKKLNDIVSQIRHRENEKGLLTQKLGFKKQNKDQLIKFIADNDRDLQQTHIDSQNLQQRIESENIQLDVLKTALLVSKNLYDTIKTEYSTAKLSFDIRQKEKQELERQVYDLKKM